MEQSDEIKRDVKSKYDQEAQALNNEKWLEQGSVRVPESKSAHYFIDRKVDMALRMSGAASSDGRSVLEVGCSFGHMTSLLADRFKQLTAVDLSEESVRLAEKRLRYYGYDNVEFVADDAEELSKLADESFDLAFSFSTIRYCPDTSKAVKSINRKLKKGGTAVIDFPNKYSPWHFLIKTVLGIKPHIHDTLYGGKDAIQIMENAGFKNVEITYFLFTTKRLPEFLLPLSKVVDAVLERTPLLNKMAGIIMVRGDKI